MQVGGHYPGQLIQNRNDGKYVYRVVKVLDPTRRSNPYLATVEGTAHEVFIKEMLPTRSAEDIDREIKVTARVGEVQFRGIPRIVDEFGNYDPTLGRIRRYLVTEAVQEAQTVEHWCWGAGGRPSGSRTERQRIVQALQQLIEIVFQLRALHVVHRDINIRNVLVDRGGRLWLVDFSEGFKVDDVNFEHLALTCHHDLDVCAPECIAGRPHRPSADLWQACSLARYLLTGETLDRSTDRARLGAPLPASLPREVQRVISWGLDPEPGARFLTKEPALALLNAARWDQP
jgi:serine/threonine protein kinase